MSIKESILVIPKNKIDKRDIQTWFQDSIAIFSLINSSRKLHRVFAKLESFLADHLKDLRSMLDDKYSLLDFNFGKFAK